MMLEAEGEAVLAPLGVPAGQNYHPPLQSPGDVALEQVFELGNLEEAARKCKRGVSWKREVQSFHLNMILNCVQLQEQVLAETWRPGKGRTFLIHERGKPRLITSCPFTDRVVQRTLCDYALLPTLREQLVFSNGACIPGKGTSFALDQLERDLRAHYSEFGFNGGIMLFDFSRYFERIPVDRCVQGFARLLSDLRLVNLVELCLGGRGKVGLGLGSQVSQLAAVLYPDSVDHWLVDDVGARYGRYMDDGYVIWPDWDDLWRIGREFERLCGNLEIVMNPRKFRFIRIGEEFVFLKTCFQLLSNGDVQRRIPVEVYRRQRRRVKRLCRLVDRRVMSAADLERSLASWSGVLQRARNCTERGKAHSDVW